MSAETPSSAPAVTVAAVAEQARRMAGHVQRFGLRSASAVVDRYIGLVDRALADDLGPPLTAPVAPRDPAAVVDAAARLAASYLQMVDTVAALMPRAPVQPHRQPPAETVTAGPVQPGQTARAVLWLHNSTEGTVGDLGLTVSDLTSAEGGRLASRTISVDPPDSVPAGGTGQVRVGVDVPGDQRPGVYHGLVLMSPAPDEPVVLSVRVGCEPADSS